MKTVAARPGSRSARAATFDRNEPGKRAMWKARHPEDGMGATKTPDRREVLFARMVLALARVTPRASRATAQDRASSMTCRASAQLLGTGSIAAAQLAIDDSPFQAANPEKTMPNVAHAGGDGTPHESRGADQERQRRRQAG